MIPQMQEISWPGWETVRVLGRGSYGAVYEIQRDVFGVQEKAALKVISIPQNQSEVDELYRDGYEKENIVDTYRSHLKSIVNEYSLMRQMNGCSNIVHCDDVRYVPKEDGVGWDIYIKMELLQPLADALPAKIPEKTVIQVGKDICHALEICSRHNIIHRDIKPQNMFCSANGDYKLGDFGIAKTVGNATRGTVIGTFKYMAPEVYSNKPYGAGADIYSLGLVLYWMLNHRRLPFMPLPPAQLTAGADGDAANRRLMGEPIPAPATGSDELKRIVLKACAYDPQLRYASASEMLRDLERLEWMPVAVPRSPEPVKEPQPEPDATIRVRKAEKVPVSAPEKAAEVIQPDRKKMSWALILGIIGILVALAVIAIEIVFILQNGKEETPNQPETTVQSQQNDALAKYKYVATSSFFVNNSSVDSGSGGLDVSSADITAAKSLTDTYIAIIKSDSVMDTVREEFPNAQYAVEVFAVPGTEVIEISVCSDIYQDNLAKICYRIQELAIYRIYHIIEGSHSRIIDTASQPPETPVEKKLPQGKYSETLRFYVSRDSNSLGETSLSITESQLKESTTMVGTYCYIVTSKDTFHELEIHAGCSDFIIEAAPVGEMEILDVTISCDDESKIPSLCNWAEEIIPQRIESIVEGTVVRIVDGYS